MNAITPQVACPKCRSTVVLSTNGNVLESPLICQVCGQAFSPRFYCPDTRSPARHVLAAARLYIDNAGKVYAFCPEHTFTTYALAADSRPRRKQTPLYSLFRFLDSLLFRLALAIEGWRLASRR